MNSFGPPAAREPAFNIPALLLWAIVALVGVQAARGWLDPETDFRLLLEFAFVPGPWSVEFGWASADEVVRAAGQAAAGGPAETWRGDFARYLVARGPPPWSLLTYAALHGSWGHVLLNSVWLLAFGAPVVRRAGTGRALLLAVVAALGGVVAQWFSDPLSAQLMVGASAVVSGYMGAAATFMFAPPRAAPLGGAWSFLRDRRVILFLLVWLGANLLFGWIAEPLGLSGEGAIAWEAHIGGFLAGLLLFPFLDPRPRSPQAVRAA